MHIGPLNPAPSSASSGSRPVGANPAQDVKNLVADIKSANDPRRSIKALLGRCEPADHGGKEARQALMDLYGSQSLSAERSNEIGRQALQVFQQRHRSIPFVVLYLAHHFANQQQEAPVLIEEMEQRCQRFFPESNTQPLPMSRLLSPDRTPDVAELRTHTSRLKEISCSSRPWDADSQDIERQLKDFLSQLSIRETAGEKKTLAAFIDRGADGLMTVMAFRCVGHIAPSVFVIDPCRLKSEPVSPSTDRFLSAAARLIREEGEGVEEEYRVDHWRCETQGLGAGTGGAVGCSLLKVIDHQLRASPIDYHDDEEILPLLDNFKGAWEARDVAGRESRIVAVRGTMLMRLASEETTPPILEEGYEEEEAAPPPAHLPLAGNPPR